MATHATPVAHQSPRGACTAVGQRRIGWLHAHTLGMAGASRRKHSGVSQIPLPAPGAVTGGGSTEPRPRSGLEARHAISMVQWVCRLQQATVQLPTPSTR